MEGLRSANGLFCRMLILARAAGACWAEIRDEPETAAGLSKCAGKRRSEYQPMLDELTGKTAQAPIMPGPLPTSKGRAGEGLRHI